MNISKHLFELQNIDLKLDERHARQTEIKNILADDSIIKKAEKEISNLENLLTRSQKELKLAEYEVNTQIEKLQLNESRLYDGKINSPKELEDLQMEAAAFKKRLSSLEDVQLDSMMFFEESDENLKSAYTSMEALQEKTLNENTMLKKEFDNLQEDIEKLTPDRSSVTNSILEEHLALYEKIRIKRRGLAVVEFIDYECPACGAALTSSQAQLARSPSKFARCETCDRIFFSR